MLEKLEELEKRVGALADSLGQKAREIQALRKEKSENENNILEAMERAESLEKENAQLKSKLGAVSQREDEIRDRVKGIIDRIEQVESEIEASGEGGI